MMIREVVRCTACSAPKSRGDLGIGEGMTAENTCSPSPLLQAISGPETSMTAIANSNR